MRECEESSRSVHSRRASWLDLATGKSLKWHTCEACRGSWRVTPTVALQDKTSSLTRQLARDSNLRLVPVMRSSRYNALFGCNWLFAFLIHVTINTHTHEMWRVFRENFERETLEKNKIDSFTIFIIWLSKFLYSHPLH